MKYIILILVLTNVNVEAVTFPNKYDLVIKKWAKTYLPGVDWRMYKAQLYQESRLDPDAVSPVGAAGVGQFMPATWKEMQRKLSITGDVTNVDLSIQAGAYYMGRLRKSWMFERPEEDRLKLAQASYNAGLGNILKAQKKSGDKILYADIVKHLSDVTGHYSKETLTYVERIWKYWKQMVLSGQ